jgi:ABC-type microcin C transport system permease subunit YejB
MLLLELKIFFLDGFGGVEFERVILREYKFRFTV